MWHQRWAVVALGCFLCACGAASPSGHTFEIIEENGVPVAVSSATPRFEGELFVYEKILELRPDPDNLDETLLYGPRSMTLGDDGLYYVADNGNHRIAVFDGDGGFVRSFGNEGQGPGEMQDPTWVDVKDGVARVRESRISRFRTDGTFLDIVTWAGGSGGIHIADNGSRVVIDLPQGDEEDGYYYLRSRARVIDDADEVVVTIETPKVAFAQTMPDTMLGRAVLHYAATPESFLRPGNEILTSPGNEPVINWYGLDGELKRQARIELPLEPVMSEDRAAVEDRYDRLIEHNMRFGGNEQLRDMLLGDKESARFAEHRAFWSRTHVDDPGGWLWLTVPAPSFAVYTRGAPRLRQQQTFRILSPEGEFIGTTAWPPEVGRFATNVVRGHLLAMVPDPETEEEIPTVYRIRPAVEGLIYP